MSEPRVVLIAAPELIPSLRERFVAARVVHDFYPLPAVIAIFKSPGVDQPTLSYYDSLGEGLAAERYNGDVIYSAP